MYPIGGGAMFNIVPVIVIIGFIVVIAGIAFHALRGGAQWVSNNNSPILSKNAIIVTKRMAVSRNNHANMHGNNVHHHASTTKYYATFQFDNSERIELKIPEKEYGMLAEGDNGQLTYQGTRYKSFARNIT